ncbi:LysR family transcriptional regulator [Paenibacillus sp. N3/727]|uniref:LysR family transcriptional regulator n=1 Tax=Paenibacillus sp. N3/727 TaxID=2925845 RepID=UPI001F52CC88|nr:LysR family transcriptional regulator [Paenibacillus sp. N3/727]UNK16093.1 LysR family transcriptional regulator [Paenibacillus sp. N3/727]
MADYEWFRSFIAIYKHGSVSEAAKTRMMTQPAMSQHLASLEAEAGEALFSRASRKIVPTERGKELYSQLAPLIESLDEAAMNLKSSSLPTPAVVRIGTHYEFFSAKLLPHLHRCSSRTVIHFNEANELLALLQADNLDMIITSQRVPVPGIEYLKLMDETFVIVAPAHVKVPEDVSVSVKEKWLSTQNFISYGLELPMIRRIWREHFKKRPLLKPVHVIPNVQLILQAVESGVGLGVIPTYILDQALDDAKAKVIFEELSVNNEFFIAYKLKQKHLPPIHEIMKLLQEEL